MSEKLLAAAAHGVGQALGWMLDCVDVLREHRR